MSSNARFRIQIAGTLALAAVVVSDFSRAQTGEATQRFELRIENGRLADRPKTVRLKRGDKVELIWSADRRTVLHLHGYDLETTVDPAKPETMAFSARLSGRFPVESHGGTAHRVLLYLEVHPR